MDKYRTNNKQWSHLLSNCRLKSVHYMRQTWKIRFSALGVHCHWFAFPGFATVAADCAEVVAVALGVGLGGMEALVDAVEFF